nr:MAG TPA: hypothetical protein [Caudoviricetes sp.]
MFCRIPTDIHNKKTALCGRSRPYTLPTKEYG